MVLYPNKLPESERVCSGICTDSMADAGIIYDLYCLTDTGEYIIVEMQNRFHSSFLDRTLFYMCRAIGR